MPLEFQKQSNRSVRSVNDIGIAAAHDVIMPERRLVIAIDYGTTYTGIAYAYTVEERASLNEIDVVQDWGPRMGNHQKIPSVISYSLGTQNHERQWGADLSPQAVAMVHTKLQLDVEDTSEELDLILQALDGMHNLDFRYIVESKGAPRYTSKGPEEIVTDYLNRVFEYLLEAVFQPAGLRTLPVEIVVTVPPYWSYKAKNSLFRALTQAGFNNTNFPLLRRIMLVAEPEAAAIYTARYLRERSGGDMLKKGESFVLCDAGGGTVDVISYRVKQLHPTFEIECVTIPTGSKCGSIFINLAFKKWLRDLLGEKLYKLLDPTQLFTKIRSHDAEREGMRELMKRFDVLKKRFTKSQGSMTLDLPAPLENLELDSRVIGGEIEITYDDMARFFEPCVSRIIELIAVQQEQLEDLRMGLKNVFLVGGFAESPYLQESIMEHLNMRGLYLNSIETSWSAVVRGAAIFGIENKSQNTITTMSASHQSYGVRVNVPFSAVAHNLGDRVVDPLTKTAIARDRLIWLIKKGDLILSTEPREVTTTFTVAFSEISPRKGSIPILTYYGERDDAPDRMTYAEPDLCMIYSLEYDLSSVPIEEFSRLKRETTVIGPQPFAYIVPFSITMKLAPPSLHMELKMNARIIATAKIIIPDDIPIVAAGISRTPESPTSESSVGQFASSRDEPQLPTSQSLIDHCTTVSRSATQFPLTSQPIVAQSTLPTTVSGNPPQDKSLSRDDDTQTINTDGHSLPELDHRVRDKVISRLGSKILETTESFLIDLDTSSERAMKANKVAAALPTLLKEFSMELFVVAETSTQRKAATFVRRYRRKIATSFGVSVTNLDDDSGSENRSIERVDYNEKVHDWMAKRGTEYNHPIVDAPSQSEVDQQLLIQSHIHGQFKDEDQLNDDDWPASESSRDSEPQVEPLDIIGAEDAQTFLFASQAYDRLLARIRAVADGTLLALPKNGQVNDEIRDSILRIILPQESKTSQRVKKPVFTGTFEVFWQPLDFLQKQYTKGKTQPVTEVVTVIGSGIDNAQAITCGEYVEQTWPRLGTETLQALQAAINQTAGLGEYETSLSDRTSLKIQLDTKLLTVTAQGSAISIADTGELLAWLGAACRASPFHDQIAYVGTSFENYLYKPRWVFNYRMEKLTPEESAQNGGCWQALFRNSVIVKGFPIPARINSEKGLEIPLDIMAQLGGADRATVFGDQLVIKGFSTMFVPTKRVENSVIWHFLFNESNKRMPYLAARTYQLREKVDSVNYTCLSLGSTRNFLGWSSSVSLHTGSDSKDIAYDCIKATDLSYPRRPILLDKVSITGGRYINAKVTATIGQKDRGVGFSSELPYRLKIHEASRMNVVLYDTEDRRGWLVDGANALIHLARTSLSHEPYSDFPLINDVITEFPHTDPSDGAKAALNALNKIGESNNLTLLKDTPGFGQPISLVREYGVKDLVLNHWELLEIMYDHQMDIEGVGKEIRVATRDRLDGYEFLDMVMRNKKIRARAAFLKPSARGWVEFVRSIDAVTLMAKGFGNLIRPNENGNKLCSSWEIVPCERDYLVARVRHLREICRDAGRSLQDRPLEVIEGIYWHQGGALFGDCTDSCKSPCDRVQTLYHRSNRGEKALPDCFDEAEDGAVIFGRSEGTTKQFTSWWSQHPKEDSTTDQDASTGSSTHANDLSQQDSFNDSGIGTSAKSEEIGTSNSSSKSKLRSVRWFRALLSPKPPP